MLAVVVGSARGGLDSKRNALFLEQLDQRLGSLGDMGQELPSLSIIATEEDDQIGLEMVKIFDPTTPQRLVQRQQGPPPRLDNFLKATPPQLGALRPLRQQLG